MKNLLNLGKVLNKSEQANIKGGDIIVTCTFSDGTGYELTYSSDDHGWWMSIEAEAHCRNNDGTVRREEFSDAFSM